MTGALTWIDVATGPRSLAVIETPLGLLAVEAMENAVVAVDFVGEAAPVAPSTPLLRAVSRQFSDYFENPAAVFSLPLLEQGTFYRRRIWKCLAAIPVGSVLTYGQLARAAGGSPRAAGGACRSNPYAIIIPCHRVVASTGLGGYSGATAGHCMDIKRWLLKHEGLGGV